MIQLDARLHGKRQQQHTATCGTKTERLERLRNKFAVGNWQSVDVVRQSTPFRLPMVSWCLRKNANISKSERELNREKAGSNIDLKPSLHYTKLQQQVTCRYFGQHGKKISNKLRATVKSQMKRQHAT